MPVHISAWSVPTVQFAPVYMLRADHHLHILRCIHSLCISHNATCDVSHDTVILFEPDACHMNVKPSHILQCIYVLMSLHAFGKCHYCPGRYGVRLLLPLVQTD